MAEMIKDAVRSFETFVRMDFNGAYPKLIGLAVAYEKISDNPLPENPQIKEKIAIGAFRRSIAEDDVKMLWQHEIKYVLGRIRAGTLSLTENNDGVHFENTPPDVGWARDLQTSIKRQDIGHMSFKFSAQVHYERLAADTYLQVVDEGRLHEISIVTEPVYLSTSVYSRSPDGELLVNGKKVKIIDPKIPEPEQILPSVQELFEKFDSLIERNNRR
jgi:HK97 family phage prohead protease